MGRAHLGVARGARERPRTPASTCSPATRSSRGDELPWWAAATAVERVPAPVTGAPLAWRFRAPRAEPARLLPWLAARLRRPIELRTVDDLASVPGDLVVDCVGLAARELARDPLVTPLLGQIVIAEVGGVRPRRHA